MGCSFIFLVNIYQFINFSFTLMFQVKEAIRFIESGSAELGNNQKQVSNTVVLH